MKTLLLATALMMTSQVFAVAPGAGGSTVGGSGSTSPCISNTISNMQTSGATAVTGSCVNRQAIPEISTTSSIDLAKAGTFAKAGSTDKTCALTGVCHDFSTGVPIPGGNPGTTTAPIGNNNSNL